VKYRFEVKGSAPEPYVVLVEKNGDNLTLSCDCPAGSKGQHCKHRYSLLEGKDPGVVGGDRDRIEELPDLLKGTDVEAAIRDLRDAELEAERAKRRVSAAKKMVARAMAS
jgi:uncharacterized Zn finger protein